MQPGSTVRKRFRWLSAAATNRLLRTTHRDRSLNRKAARLVSDAQGNLTRDRLRQPGRISKHQRNDLSRPSNTLCQKLPKQPLKPLAVARKHTVFRQNGAHTTLAPRLSLDRQYIGTRERTQHRHAIHHVRQTNVGSAARKSRHLKQRLVIG